MHYASPSSLTTGSSACEQDICSCFLAAVVCPRTTSKAFQFLGLGCGLSEGGSLPSGVGGVSSKAAASIFVPSIAVPSRPPRSFWISQIYRSSVPLSLSRPHLANDEAHALYHGYACSESTSASLRPKPAKSVVFGARCRPICTAMHSVLFSPPPSRKRHFLPPRGTSGGLE